VLGLRRLRNHRYRRMLSPISVSPPDYTASSSVRCKAHPTLAPSPRARTTAVWHSIIVMNQARVADYDADNNPVPEVERAPAKVRNPPKQSLVAGDRGEEKCPKVRASCGSSLGI